MKILLVGEYSRFHNSLKEGLVALGHQVTIIGTGDDFKKYPVDIDISPRWTTGNWLKTKVRRALYRLTKKDITAIEIGRRFQKELPKLKGYGVVQLINSWSIRTTVEQEKKFVTYLAENNEALFLSACGTDTYWVEDLLEDRLPYHLLTPYVQDRSKASQYQAALRYITPARKELFDHVITHAKAMIPTDMDYHMSLRENSKATNLIPTPINLSKLDFKPVPVTEKIVIFHGINRISYYKKGNDVFEKALKIVKEKHNEKIEIITVESLPYEEYIKAYDRAHILLDQVYSHDQGYNALEAMAKGKVVFTGAGSHFKAHYEVTETVAIDATPDPAHIASELERLILHPEQIAVIGKAARAFVEEFHDHVDVAKKYLEVWGFDTL